MPETRLAEIAMDVDAQGRRLALGAHTVRAIGELVLRRERAGRALLSVSFVSRSAIARLNRRHLGHRGATDVITFALGRTGRGAPVIGDIYIAPDVVREQARRLGVPARQELARVIIHGVLHALGRAHPDNLARFTSPMWRRQERLLVQARREGLL
jgi:probable rRNA maturation factor